MKRRAFVLTAAVAMLVLSACESAPTSATNSTGDPAPQSITQPLVKAVTANPDIASKLPSGVSSLQVGSNLQSPPGTFMDADGKTPVGVEIDLINAIANRLGVKLDIKNQEFDTLISSLQSERIDLVVASMQDNSRRQQLIDFVDYFNDDLGVIVKKGNPKNITGPSDLCGKNTSAAPGSSQEKWAKEMSTQLCTNGTVINMTPNSNDQQRLNDLRTGRLDAVINDKANLIYVASTAGQGKDFEVIQTEKPIAPTLYGFGFNKANSQLRDAVASAFDSLIQDGTYQKILDAWKVSNAAVEKVTVNAGK